MPLTDISWRDKRGETFEAPIADFLEAMKAPDAVIPYPLAASMLENEERPDEGFSATQLISGCISCKVLQACEPYTEAITDLWYRWRGSMLHGVLAKHALPGHISEVRFYTETPFGVFHGKPDLIDPVLGILDDYKTTKRVPMWAPWNNHVEQLNFYRWLVNHASRWDAELPNDPRYIEFNRMFITYIDDAGVKRMECTTSRQVATKPGAKNPTKTVKEPAIWSDEEVEALLFSRYQDLADATERYRNTGTLPAYLPDFDEIRDWKHQYSPTASRCVRAHIRQGDPVYA